MLNITIKIAGDAKVMRKLKTLRNIDFTQANREIGKELVDYYGNDAFATRGTVFGKRWPEYNPAYKVWKEKKYAGRGMLQLTGTMQKSFFSTVTKNTVTIDNHSPIYKYHQSSAPRTKMPRRQMAGVNGKAKDIVRTAITKDLNRILAA